jgi:hypothetical protein
MLLSKYPGFLRGSARLRKVEEVLRAASMFPGRENIAGLEVLRLTPRHIDQLLLIDSPFLFLGRPRLPEHVAQFLWIVSPFNPLNGYRAPARARDRSFFRRLFHSAFRIRHSPLSLSARDRFLLDLTARFRPLTSLAVHRRLCRAIDRYWDRMTLDQPPSGGGRRVPVSFSASVVNKIATAYGWPDEVLDEHGTPIPGKGILDMPIPRLYQYWRWITVTENPDTPLFSKRVNEFQERTKTRWRARAAAAGFEDDPITMSPRLDGIEKYLIATGRLNPGRPIPTS